MRKSLIAAILAVILLLCGLLFGEKSYKPFRKLTGDELLSAVLTLGAKETLDLSSPQTLSRCAAAMREISVLFSGEEDGEALAVLEAELSGGAHVVITLYENAVALDERTYSISPSESAALLKHFEAIP